MSLRILLADDSMTAQNMGKKILSDAGYEVTAVSNGAAALKKSTELKPDLVVLDIYMPGYTGLEVCERLKNSPDTAHIPVMLTVGKLEPYRPEEGARVRAEGVIIKPFEATDLLAAVQKLASSIGSAVPEPEPEKPAPAPAAPFVVSPPAAEIPVISAPDLAVANPLDVALPSFDGTGSAHAAMPAFDIDPLQDFAVAPAAPAAQPLSLDVAELETLAPEATSAINLDFLRTPAETPVIATIEDLEPTSAPKVEVPAAAVELEYSLEPTQRQQSVDLEISADPSLVTDPADVAAFALKVSTVDPALEQESEPEPMLEPAELVPPSFTLSASEAPRELDVVELFHEEYDPAADGSIDLSVPARQTATPPPIPVYENAGVTGYAVTPAMRDYLERQQEVAATASIGFADLEAASQEVPVAEALAAEAPEVEAVALAIEPPREPTPEESPLDVDALLGTDLGIEPVAPTEVAAEAVAEPVIPEVVPETTEPEPATVESVFDLADFDAAPTEMATEVVEPAAPSVEAEVEAVNVEPLDLVPELAEPTPVVSDLVSPIADEAVDIVSAPTVVAAAPEPRPTPVPEPEPQVAAALAQIPEVVAAEVPAGSGDGLSAVDRARIAGVIQRVFDHYKPQIIADIARELMKDR